MPSKKDIIAKLSPENAISDEASESLYLHTFKSDEKNTKLHLQSVPSNNKNNKLSVDNNDETNMVVVFKDGQLKPTVGLFSAIAIVIGSIIGSGIFVSPKGITLEVRSLGASLIVWLVGGLFSLLGAYCYAELGCLIRDSGSDYSYIRHAMGDCVGFLRLWTELMVIRPCSLAVLALAFSGYIIEPIFPVADCPNAYSQGYLDYASRMLAAACILSLAAINCTSVSLTTKLQNIFTIGKLIALLVIIVSGIVVVCLRGVANYENPFEGSSTSASSYALAFYSSLFAYGGWSFLNCVIEEMKNPVNDLPKAIIIGCITTIFVYLLTILAYISVVSIQEMILVQSVGALFAQRLYGKAAIILPFFVVMSTFGSINGSMLTSSRLCFVGARQGHLPAILNTIQISRITPVPAIIFTAITSLVFLLIKDIYTMINYVGFATTAMVGLSVFTVIIFRYTKPNDPRPIKVWLGWPILFLIGTIVLLFFAFIGDPTSSLISLSLVLTGLPIYLICCVMKKPKSLQRKIDNLNRILQRIFMTIPESQ